MKKFLKPMIHCSTFVEQQMYPTNVEKCIMYCWMLKYAIEHAEWQLIIAEKNRAWVYSFQQVAACWTTSTNRFRVWCHSAWWKDQTWRLKLGLYWNMELWECVNMAWYDYATLPRECSMPQKRSCFLAILQSTITDFFVFFFPCFINAATTPPCEQSLFYLFPSYTEKIGSAQI